MTNTKNKFYNYVLCDDINRKVFYQVKNQLCLQVRDQVYWQVQAKVRVQVHDKVVPPIVEKLHQLYEKYP